MRSIYLDHNATTPLDPRVGMAIRDYWSAGYGNPASQHRAGRRAAQVLEDTREAVAQFLGATSTDRVVFTSGATEANNLALFGFAGKPPGRILIGATEHPSVSGPAEQLERAGFDVHRIRVNADGLLDLDHLRDRIDSHTRLVSVIGANHETGVLQPLETLATICREAHVPLHTDAVQLVGKVPIDFHNLGVSALSLSAHKFHGPLGIGAIVLRSDTRPTPQLFGGFQQDSIRPGSEPVGLVVGLAKALEIWWDEREARLHRLTRLRDRFEDRLRSSRLPIEINGLSAPRAPHTSNVAFPGLDRQALLMALDLGGIACSTGSACASGSSEPSPVLRAMGLEDRIIFGSLRFSLGAGTTEDDVDQAAGRILSIANDLRSQAKAQENPATSPHSLAKPL